MSGHQAIAAVTTALQRLLQQSVSADPFVTSGQVTTRPPDKARITSTGNQLNLFLYRTALDAAWRNQDPSGIRHGESGEPALPLVLSYLVTAYGEDDDEILSHRLLGIAMSVLNDQPVLSRALLAQALPGSGIELQSERVRIVPHPIPLDEISRMWATFQTGYRISTTYDVAVVLIDSARPLRAAPPVLTRGPDDAGPFALPSDPDNTELPPVVLEVELPSNRPVALPGDVLTLRGKSLGAVTEVRVRGAQSAPPVVLVPASVTPTAVTVAVPPADLAAGAYLLVAAAGSEPDASVSTGVRVDVAPVIESTSPVSVRLPKKPKKPSVTITIDVAPTVQPAQSVALIVGDQLLTGQPRLEPSRRLTFTTTAVAPGRYAMRVRVDGLDGLLRDADGAAAMPILEVLA